MKSELVPRFTQESRGKTENLGQCGGGVEKEGKKRDEGETSESEKGVC